MACLFLGVPSRVKGFQELHDPEVGCSALNTATSALSTHISLVNNATIGTHLFVQRFIRAVSFSPGVGTPGTPSEVLQYLRKFHSLQELSLKSLTYKLVMFRGLVTGQHCQTVYLMKLQNIRKDGATSYLLYIDQLVNHSAISMEQPLINITRFRSDERLCRVASALEE